MARYRQLDYSLIVQQHRRDGKSVSQLARLHRVSESAIRYALSPERRLQSGTTPAGRRRTVYMPARMWDALATRADEAGVSRSILLQRLALGSAPPLELTAE